MLARRCNVFQLNCKHGFTAIEVIAVLIIIGIFAAVVVSRATSTQTFSVYSEAEILKSHLRFAQLKAMGDLSSDTWGIVVGSGSYTLTCTGVNCPANIPNLPGESSNVHLFRSVLGPSTTQTINFDSWGSPDNSPTITLSSGSNNASITITPNTGFIQ